VFRTLKSELGLRPVFHQKEDRTEGHLFITVLLCSPFQAAGTEILCLSSKLFSASATGQGRRHGHRNDG
jgi:hypothetical protein